VVHVNGGGVIWGKTEPYLDDTGRWLEVREGDGKNRVSSSAMNREKVNTKSIGGFWGGFVS